MKYNYYCKEINRVILFDIFFLIFWIYIGIFFIFKNRENVDFILCWLIYNIIEIDLYIFNLWKVRSFKVIRKGFLIEYFIIVVFYFISNFIEILKLFDILIMYKMIIVFGCVLLLVILGVCFLFYRYYRYE